MSTLRPELRAPATTEVMLGAVPRRTRKSRWKTVVSEESRVTFHSSVFLFVYSRRLHFGHSSPNTYVPKGGHEGERGKVRRVGGGMDSVSVTCSAAARGDHRGGAAWSTCRAELSPPSSAGLYTRCLADQYPPIILPVAPRQRPRTTGDVTRKPLAFEVDVSRSHAMGYMAWQPYHL